jgi:hypothetical protein
VSGAETVKKLLERGFKLVFWPDDGDAKGPRGKGAETWLSDAVEGKYTFEHYREGMRVGIMHGVPLDDAEHIVCDVDIDYQPGMDVALAMLPTTQFVWGRDSKPVSHLLYTVTQAAPQYVYKDIGKNPITLLEFRPDPHQSMAPPSVWQKEGKREPLTLRAEGPLAHFENDTLKQRVTLAAIGMLLAKHLGKHGFGHETRLAWAGFLMRLGVGDEDLQRMGVALSKACSNSEVDDVRRVIQSTRNNLAADGKKVKGGPAFAKIIGEHGRQVISRIAEWLGRDADFVRDKDGKIIPKNQENIRRAVELLNYDLTYDQFSDRMLVNGQAMDDKIVENIYFQVDGEYKFMPPYDFFTQKLRHIAWQNAYHPVKDYLNALTWDGVPRLDAWLITCAGAEDSKYTRAVSSILLLAAVRRIYHPGSKYDEMVVWESPQGIGKSSAARMLCPNPDWFSDDLPLTVDSKQIIERTLGKWIIEVGELAGKRKAEQEQLKSMLSRQVDGPARMAYGRFPVERPRQFILIGTTNLDNYLADPTGGRRWWPLKVTRFDLEWIATNRDQLWAEARHREQAGEPTRLDEELWPEAAARQEDRQIVEPWEQIIRDLIMNTEPGMGQRRRVITDDIWTALGVAVERRDRFGALRISEIMQKLGFQRTRIRPTGETTKVGFIQIDFSKMEEIGDVEELETGAYIPGRDDAPF